jgi:hypothetical protein
MSIDLRVQLTAYRIALDHSEQHQMAQPGQRVGDADWQAHAGKAPDETDRPGRSAEFWAAAQHLGASLTSIIACELRTGGRIIAQFVIQPQ